MKKIIFLTIRLILFWIILFAVQHTLFLLYNNGELKGIPVSHILWSYYYALGMDLSATAYLMFLPGILLFFAIFLQKNYFFIKTIHIYNVVLIIACVIIGLADTGLYSVWGSKINNKALSYLSFPKEALMSFAAVPYWLFIAALIVQCVLFAFVYKRVFRPGYFSPVKPSYKIVYAVVILACLFLAMRGGYQKYPISKSRVYYSKYSVLNYSALNGFWNFMELIVNPENKINPYRYFAKEKAEEIVKAMHNVKADSTQYVLSTTRPNIVLILLESVSAECMEKLNGTKGLMPGIDSLAGEGLLFSNFYANGFRTEQGLISLLNSFPAQPKTSIMRKLGKFGKLPNFARLLGDSGYSQNYYYSGSLEFAKTRAYLALSGFTHIFDEDNHDWKNRTDWGAYDEELFACHLKEGLKDSVPFFSIIMTSTSHEPFKADVEKVFNDNTAADDYKNTVHYTDKCLVDYLKKAREMPWYNNTLFIISSDHAHSFPNQRRANEPERHRIPFMLYGNVLKPEFKGKIIYKTGSQIDFPAIILSQLKIPCKQFARSKNLLNKYSPEFGFYTFDNGFGIITPKQIIVYDHLLGQVVYSKNKLPSVVDDEITRSGKAYLQLLIEEYIGFNN